MYDYLEVNEHYYWSMEDREAPPACTILINRAIRLDYSLPEPPWWPNGPESAIAALMDTYTPMVGGRSVLDIGCGWPASGKAAGFYQGIGPAGDVARLGALDGISTTVSYFVPRAPERFDIIVCGASSLLQPNELERLPLLLAPGGRIVLIFSAEKYRLMAVGHGVPGSGRIKGVVYDHGEHVVVVHG